MRWLLCVGVLAALPAMAQPKPKPDPFPPGPGHDIVAVACVQCHASALIQALRMNEAGWRRQTEIMIVRGAQIGPEEIDAVSSYLASAFGPGVPFAAPFKQDVHLADGAGSALVAQDCGFCHGLDRVVAARRSGTQWAAIVQRMRDVGAPLDDGQQKQVVDYLETNYGGIRNKP